MPPIIDNTPGDHDNHGQEVTPDRPTVITHTPRSQPMSGTMLVTHPIRLRRNKQATYWYKDYQMNATLVYQ